MTKSEVLVTNREATEAVIARLSEADRNGWLATLARTSAAAVDETGQAAAIAQHRQVMSQLEALTSATQEANPLDELRDRRAARARAAEDRASSS